MVTLKTKYRGVEFSIEAENGVKSLMADVVASIDYLHTRETVGEYSGKGETETPVEKEDKPKKSSRASKSKADERVVKEKAEPAPEYDEDTDPGDGVDEEAEEAGAVETKAEEPAEEELTIDAVREAVMAYTEVKGAVAGKKLVSDVGGATKLSEVKPAKYAALVKAAKAGA